MDRHERVIYGWWWDNGRMVPITYAVPPNKTLLSIDKESSDEQIFSLKRSFTEVKNQNDELRKLIVEMYHDFKDLYIICKHTFENTNSFEETRKALEKKRQILEGKILFADACFQ